jgi:hypothetical protein
MGEGGVGRRCREVWGGNHVLIESKVSRAKIKGVLPKDVSSSEIYLVRLVILIIRCLNWTLSIICSPYILVYSLVLSWILLNDKAFPSCLLVRFTIDSTRGVIKTAAILDRETINTHSIRVLAQDTGIPQLLAEVRVTVNVTDINDHRPTFSQRRFTVTVMERSPPQVILTVSVRRKETFHNTVQNKISSLLNEIWYSKSFYWTEADSVV